MPFHQANETSSPRSLVLQISFVPYRATLTRDAGAVSPNEAAIAATADVSQPQPHEYYFAYGQGYNFSSMAAAAASFKEVLKGVSSRSLGSTTVRCLHQQEPDSSRHCCAARKLDLLCGAGAASDCCKLVEGRWPAAENSSWQLVIWH